MSTKPEVVTQDLDNGVTWCDQHNQILVGVNFLSLKRLAYSGGITNNALRAGLEDNSILCKFWPQDFIAVHGRQLIITKYVEQQTGISPPQSPSSYF